ncbi:KRAB-A domain-containing protein 2 [Ciconia boyciana]|uniref:KRAB-A domain-containing protein 2 n=1 Tax=Ciconia boyciana TaxID=52775 RepID=UPI003B9EF57F
MEHHTALQQIIQKMHAAWSSRRILPLPISLIICNGKDSPYAVICQWQNKKGEFISPLQLDATAKCKGQGDMFNILEWVFLGVQPKMSIQTRTEAIGELIRKGRSRTIEISGQEPGDISIHVSAVDVDWWLRNDEAIQNAFLGYGGKIHSQQPQGKLWQLLRRNQWIQRYKVSKNPLPGGVTVYTDAGKRLRRAACVWKEGDNWKRHIMEGQLQDSLQTLELTAVVWALTNWINIPLNVVTDSMYVAGVVPRLEDALLRETTNPRLGNLFVKLRSVLGQRTAACCIIHIRSHQLDIGLGQGNQLADSLVSPVCHVPPMDKFQQARQSHENFHQNAKGLRRQFNVTENEAKGIIQACPKCGNHGPGIGSGVNPKGLKALELWQMDVTHVPEFGRLKYLHVTIDTFSKMIWATVLPGERAHHVCKHLLACFAVLGVPERIKTDNGPAYVSQKVRAFLARWGVDHVTGIPHSPTGQGLVERTHQVLKDYLDKQRGIEVDPQQRLHRVLFTLNFLCLMGDREEPPVVIHHQHLKFNSVTTLPQVKVKYRDPASGMWLGPVPVIFNGRGYMCVSTDRGPVWVPSRNVKPVLAHRNSSDEQDEPAPDNRGITPGGNESSQD